MLLVPGRTARIVERRARDRGHPSASSLDGYRAERQARWRRDSAGARCEGVRRRASAGFRRLLQIPRPSLRRQRFDNCRPDAFKATITEPAVAVYQFNLDGLTFKCEHRTRRPSRFLSK